MQNDFYWMIKHFDNELLEHFRHKFNMDSGMVMMKKMKYLIEEAVMLHNNNVAADSIEGQKFAIEFWKFITEFTGGDMSLLPKLMEVGEVNSPNKEWAENQRIPIKFIEKTLDVYFETLDYDPFEEGIG